MTRRTRNAARGQNMVLLALTMLFLALMVTMTIGLGLRIRQNHELQNVADAAAYSNAVVTARAFNNAALLNRLEVSFYVSQAADQSLISWTTYGRALFGAAEEAANDIAATRLPKCQADNDEATSLASALTNEENRLFQGWEVDDHAAASESEQIQFAVAGLRAELRPSVYAIRPDNLQDRLFDDKKNQTVTRQVLAAAQLSDVSVVTGGPGARNGPEAVNLREVDCDFGTAHSLVSDDPPPHGGYCARYTWSLNMLQAAMGTRGSPFVTGRGTMPDLARQRLASVDRGLNYATITATGPTGSGYWANGLMHGRTPTTTEAWADDHGSVTVSVRDRAGVCGETVTRDANSHVRSTHEDEHTDEHEWTGQREPDANPAHTMGDCKPLCPSVWVRTPGFQPVDAADDAWGQPKAVVVLERDLTARRFPWELHFSFPFSATGTARAWDARGKELHGANAGLDISRQTALSTAMAYYHRRQHWEEFPNLLNPFWRATLVPTDVDQSGDLQKGGTDVMDALYGREHGFQRDAYESLVRSGYKGLH